MQKHLHTPHLLRWLFAILALPGFAYGGDEAVSALWGRNGERWTATGRLPDFSFAGYHCGESTIPDLPPGRSVREFGAVGDGEADDTQAFLDAVAAVKRGAIEVPPGRYRITQPIAITRPGVVLRGAGPEKTTLYFPLPLNDIKPDWGKTSGGRRTSNYSWSGGFITLRGNIRSAPIGRVAEPVPRGHRAIPLRKGADVAPGQWIVIAPRDTGENTLPRHLYSNDPGDTANLKGRLRTSFAARVVARNGDTLTLHRPLSSDLRLEWQPEIRSFKPTLFESGIEGLRFEFPDAPYRGHFTELGWNAINLVGAAHCWVRDIHMHNGDSGIHLKGGHFNTLLNIRFTSVRKPDARNCVGHHGISIGGNDTLVTGFDFQTRFIHDLTLSRGVSGNVFSRGRGVDLSLDHHRFAPFENLFTRIDAGSGRRLWLSGGGVGLGKHCAARGTFWNIRAENPLRYPPPGFGPASMNLVGLHTDQPGVTEPNGKWFETIPPEQLRPPNLHEAQLSRRINGE